jgi:hypothetical protein
MNVANSSNNLQKHAPKAKYLHPRQNDFVTCIARLVTNTGALVFRFLPLSLFGVIVHTVALYHIFQIILAAPKLSI